MAQHTSLLTKTERNPTRAFVYSVVWLVIAFSMGYALLGLLSEGTSPFDVNGQRTGGVILFLPFVALAASIFCLVRGILAIAPYRIYLQKTTPAQRRQLENQAWKNQGPPIGIMVAFTILLYLGLLTLLIVFVTSFASNETSTIGVGIFTALLLLVGLLVAFFTEVLVRIVRAKSK